jgi:hypothetical protein
MPPEFALRHLNLQGFRQRRSAQGHARASHAHGFQKRPAIMCTLIAHGSILYFARPK